MRRLSKFLKPPCRHTPYKPTPKELPFELGLIMTLGYTSFHLFYITTANDINKSLQIIAVASNKKN